MTSNNKYKILLVEDEVHIRNFVAAMLENSAYQVIHAENGEMAKVMFNSYRPDLMILDLGLPDMDGMNVLDAIRQESMVPIIVLSARINEEDKVLALDHGANDYVTKPFGTAELLARIRSTLRNHRLSAMDRRPGAKFVLQDLVIDYDARQVTIAGEKIKLTQTEYNIVALLSEHCGKMMTYSAIIKGIWGYQDEGSIKRLQVNMANIRRKFGSRPGEPKYIVNELGVGYRMEESRQR